MMHGAGGHWGGPGGNWSGRGGLDDEDRGRIYDHEVVKRLVPYLKEHMGMFLLAVLLMLAYTATTVATPWLIASTLDSYVFAGSGDLSDLDRAALLSGLTRAALLLVVIVVGNAAANYVYMRVLGKISQQVLYKMRTAMFDHLQALSVPFFDRNEVGRIMSRVMSDVNQLQEFLPTLTLTLGDMISLVGIVTVMLLMSVKLALVTFVVVPFLIIIMAVWQRYARTAFVRVRSAISVVNSRLQQNISGVRVVQSFNREELNLRQFDNVNRDHLDANLWAIRLSAILMPTVEVLTAIALGLVILVGGAMVLDGELLAGALVGFALYVQRFFDPIRSLTMQYTQFQRAMTAGQRIFELLDAKPEVVDRPDAQPMPAIRGEIAYENVTFEYIKGRPVLQDINLRIRPGQTVALVGQTGAGKSTMVSLVARFYDVTQGRITVDGHDLREVTRESLASQMGMVLQEPFLYSVSVAGNIRFKHTDAPMEKVIEAAKAVGAHDFIMRLEHGYDTVLHERGGNLSLGQRQLISFARAVLAAPRILILDEATANIDTFTEVLIQSALRELLKDRTAIVIAHRLSTIQNADMIVVMDQGRIVDTGTHDELLGRSPIYTKLHSLNFQDEPAAAEGALDEGDVAPASRPSRA
ncbi:MAG: ABC transporter ATP-binding protein [Chloroflexi bacterium]|nr:ABC transporter ATP-binding protein [Chloroflexota bacterium]